MDMQNHSAHFPHFSVDVYHRNLLGWYRQSHRLLPWRPRPGGLGDPYHVWLSEIMLQQTVVAAVIPYFQEFLKNWPRFSCLAAASVEDILDAWAGLGYYSRARNLHRGAQKIVVDHQGIVPRQPETLEKIPGIGPYSARAIAAMAFGQPVTPLDANVLRVLSRLWGEATPLPNLRPTLQNRADALAPQKKVTPPFHNADHAQALIELGARICRPKTPNCVLCPIQEFCYARQNQQIKDFPVKPAKRPKPKRAGIVFWVENDKGEVLLNRRPRTGLLAGLLEIPSGKWEEEKADLDIPDWCKSITNWQKQKGVVEHSFTHFDLQLKLYFARAPESFVLPKGYFWQPKTRLIITDFPSLMRKVIRRMC